jgi:hypothetical protein
MDSQDNCAGERRIMETNLLEIAKETVAHTGPPTLSGVMVEWGPMGVFVVAVNFLFGIAVACIALVNAMTHGFS